MQRIATVFELFCRDAVIEFAVFQKVQTPLIALYNILILK